MQLDGCMVPPHVLAVRGWTIHAWSFCMAKDIIYSHTHLMHISFFMAWQCARWTIHFMHGFFFMAKDIIYDIFELEVVYTTGLQEIINEAGFHQAF